MADDATAGIGDLAAKLFELLVKDPQIALVGRIDRFHSHFNSQGQSYWQSRWQCFSRPVFAHSGHGNFRLFFNQT